MKRPSVLDVPIVSVENVYDDSLHPPDARYMKIDKGTYQNGWQVVHSSIVSHITTAQCNLQLESCEGTISYVIYI